MNKKHLLLSGVMLATCSIPGIAAGLDTQLAVWANEAIVATYTYDYKNYLQEQKEIAKYFSANGWINYNKALTDSKLADSVQKNNYFVTAVATQPPEIKQVDATHWQATMPVLVVYKNKENQQQQNLRILLTFSPAKSGQGVRGYSIDSLQSTVISPPCQCAAVNLSSPQPATNGAK